MTRVSRRAWAELRFAHPGVDPANPSDEFATALLTLAGVDPDVWVCGGEAEALTAYTRALNVAVPDHTWASDALDADPNLALEVSVCNDLAIPHSVFLGWDERDQDLAIASAIRKTNTCPNGHPRDAMNDLSRVQVGRVFCAVCARIDELHAMFQNAPEDQKRGYATEVTRVPR